MQNGSYTRRVKNELEREAYPTRGPLKRMLRLIEVPQLYEEEIHRHDVWIEGMRSKRRTAP